MITLVCTITTVDIICYKNRTDNNKHYTYIVRVHKNESKMVILFLPVKRFIAIGIRSGQVCGARSPVARVYARRDATLRCDAS